MNELPPPPPERGLPPAGAAIGAAVLGGLPIGLFLVLNYLRPDLMAPMLDHVFGRAFVAAVLLLTTGGTGCYLLAALARFQSRTPRVLVGLAGLACTLPALALVLFGPIVFAFMFGNAGG